MNPRPKIFTAVCDFSVAGRSFATGDVVDDLFVLDVVLRFGEQFVSSDTSRRRKASEANPVPGDAESTTTTNPEVSP